jgi:hypothetical protein
LFFINKSLPIEKMFDNFHRRLEGFHPVDYESALKCLFKVYPDLKDLSVDCLDEALHDLAYQTVDTLFYSECSHQWEEVYAHKLGNLYLCRGECHRTVLYPVVDKDGRDQID